MRLHSLSLVAAVLGCGTTDSDPASSGSDGQPGLTSSSPASSGSESEHTSTDSPGATSSPGADTGTDSDDDGDEPPIFDVPTPDGGPLDPPEKTPSWLVHIGNVDGQRHLFHIDIETAEATDVCVLTDAETGQPYSGQSPSVTFSRDDRLLFSSNTGLWEFELPSCIATHVGEFGYSQVWGISPDEGNDLYGLDALTDQLIHIDAQTGQATAVGPLGQDWTTLGGTWNEVEQRLYGINASTDALYEIDQLTGMGVLANALPLDFEYVGVEFHPLTEQIYACTSSRQLYRLEADGSLTDLGDMGLPGCNNLGAPWSTEVVLPPPPG
ncbi:MAG: hypothetical protein AAF799_17400 [Myxococcota bacterium]